MRHPWSVPVLLALAALAGYAARPVQAQTEPLPFSTGDTVTFSNPEGTWKCRIEEIRGTFAHVAIRLGRRSSDRRSPAGSAVGECRGGERRSGRLPPSGKGAAYAALIR